MSGSGNCCGTQAMNKQITVEDRLRTVLQKLEEDGSKLAAQAQGIASKVGAGGPTDPWCELSYPWDLESLANAISVRLDDVIRCAANSLSAAHDRIGDFTPSTPPPAVTAMNASPRR